jgi:hypothetical protein
MLSITLLQIRIKYWINFFMYYLLLQQKGEKLSNLFSNLYLILYLSFEKIYDEFEVYLL